MNDRNKFLGLMVVGVSAIIVMKVSIFTGVLMLLGFIAGICLLAIKRG